MQPPQKQRKNSRTGAAADAAIKHLSCYGGLEFHAAGTFKNGRFGKHNTLR